MSRSLHKHVFENTTSINDMHRHVIRGSTLSSPNVPYHVHLITVATTFDDGHSHRVSVTTGPEMEVKGGHIHYFNGMTSMVNGHIHYFSGYTSIS